MKSETFNLLRLAISIINILSDFSENLYPRCVYYYLLSSEGLPLNMSGLKPKVLNIIRYHQDVKLPPLVSSNFSAP